MSDLFVQLSANPTARKAIKTLHLPVPLPPILKRSTGPWEDRPLNDLPVVVSHGKGGVLAPTLSAALVASGADIWLDGPNPPMAIYREAGEAWSRMPKLTSEQLPSDFHPHGIVLDGTGIQTASDLKEAYAFFHPWVRNVRSCGRALLIARPVTEATTISAMSALRGLEGFVRSLAKEMGRKGSTAQILYASKEADSRLEPVLRFLLSYRSAYISGQPITVSPLAQNKTSPLLTKSLEGKTALVTGAARGIGAATAQALAREGAHVIIMDLPSEQATAQATADKVHGTAFGCDMTAPDASEVILAFVRDHVKGGLDVVVHNAGITRDKTLGNMEESRWDQVLEVNLNAILRVNEALLSVLNDRGRIICLSSVGGIAGNVGQTNYATTKAALIGFVQALAPSVASRGITVNAVAPGFIETRMTAAVPLARRQMARWLSNLSQGGLPEDVAETITFLASPGAVGVTGQVIRVCGGSLVGA